MEVIRISWGAKEWMRLSDKYSIIFWILQGFCFLKKCIVCYRPYTSVNVFCHKMVGNHASNFRHLYCQHLQYSWMKIWGLSKEDLGTTLGPGATTCLIREQIIEQIFLQTNKQPCSLTFVKNRRNGGKIRNWSVTITLLSQKIDSGLFNK